MTALEVLEELVAIGVAVRLAEPGQVALSPEDRIPAAMKPAIVETKLELAAIVEGRIHDRAQLVVDAFEQLAVKFSVLPMPRCATSPEEAGDLERLIAATISYAAEEPFREALKGFVALVEQHFAQHLLAVCHEAQIELESVTVEGHVVLRARPTEGQPIPDGLGRALRTLRGPLLAILPSASAQRRAHR
ncbi:MAG TPA: hypothetical protein VNF75_09150 [Candidatus Dormibacteraeota bacterium]|nr:hypothetical protein [Candidatus Dormibacteraeota bacterium]